MTSVLDGDGWRGLPDRDKQHLRDRLREACARAGVALDTSDTPGRLAEKHVPGTARRDYLDRIDRDLVWVRDTPNAKLMIFTPSQVGKSTRVSRWFPFWWLTQKPRDRIILASYASSLAMGHAAACRDFIADYGREYGLRLRDDEATKSDWTLTTGGGYRARGVRSGLVGQPMDLGIIDDPFADRAAADSPTIREAVWNWYSSAFATRRAPECREVLVMHRWHTDDLAGRLLAREGREEEGGQWRVLHLPAIALAPDRERGIYPDPLGREPGAPLQHPKIAADDTTAQLRHWDNLRMSLTARDWQSLALGLPISAEGALLDDTLIRARTGTPGPAVRIGVGVDPSGGGRDTAGIVAGLVDESGRFWWTHSRTGRMSSDRWPREVCLLANEVGADRIVFESNYGGDMSSTLIRQAWSALQTEGAIPVTALCPYIRSVHTRRKKILRAEPIAQAVTIGRIGFATDPSLRDLTTEWTQWEPGSTWSPGALDAAVHLAADLLPQIGAGATTHSVAAKRRDSVAASGGVAARRR
ncbi:terminase family protein [Nocardia sp. CC201C]|uniref:terminase large subunit domain-containing protein n=1 Tax=Nocardia sp. CC201C TaxID=3044575 RepID=UPI0024A7C8D9|nr:terminase family protein [Nocardia sp. CC201C]